MRDERTYAVIGAAMEVHRIVGGGFGENVCADALAIELGLRKIPFKTEVPFPVHYKRHRLRSFYRADLVCFDSVIVGLKVLRSHTGPMEEAQMINYLRAAEMTVALLFNFGMPSLEYRRFVLSPEWHRSRQDMEKPGEPGQRAAKPRAIGLSRAAEE